MFSVLSIFTNIKNSIIAGFTIVIIVLSITVWQKNRTIANLENDLNKSKLLNNYYELQFKSLANSYQISLENFKNKKETIRTVYRDKIKTAAKIVPTKECDYLKKRIKEYVEDNNITK